MTQEDCSFAPSRRIRTDARLGDRAGLLSSAHLPSYKGGSTIRTAVAYRSSTVHGAAPARVCFWHVCHLLVLTASLNTPPSVTRCVPAPAPVMIFGSFTPSPLQSKPPLSITIVPLPTRVFAPVVASKISPMSPALRCRAFPTKTFPHANLANTPPLAEPVMTLERKVLFSINKVGKSGLPENRMP